MYLFVVQPLPVVRNRRLAAWMTSFPNAFTFLYAAYLLSLESCRSSRFPSSHFHLFIACPLANSSLPCALALRTDNHTVKSP